jgi:hypothetical protein
MTTVGEILILRLDGVIRGLGLRSQMERRSCMGWIWIGVLVRLGAGDEEAGMVVCGFWAFCFPDLFGFIVSSGFGVLDKCGGCGLEYGRDE